MATDGPTPPDCDADVYRNGTILFVTHTIPSCSLETWVKRVAERSGQRVDWHFDGGRANIKALGDLDAVKRAIRELMDDHDARYTAAVKKIDPDFTTLAPPRPKWW